MNSTRSIKHKKNTYYLGTLLGELKFMFAFSGLTYGQVAILNVSQSENKINSSISDETGESPTLSSTVTSLINQTISSVLSISQVKFESSYNWSN